MIKINIHQFDVCIMLFVLFLIAKNTKKTAKKPANTKKGILSSCLLISQVHWKADFP